MIATDSELFIEDKNGNVVDPSKITTGTKESPEDIGNGCSLQVDCATVEFAVPPCGTPEALVGYVKYCIDRIKERMPEGSHIRKSTSMDIGEDTVRETPSFSVFGCDPDISAYKGIRGAFDLKGSVRYAGGHIHIDVDTDEDGKKRFVKILDEQLAEIIADCYEESGQDSFQRIESYGAAGVYRSKPYGVEYRSMPNNWIMSVDSINAVFKAVNKSLSLFKEGYESSRSEEIFNETMMSSWKKCCSSVLY